MILLILLFKLTCDSYKQNLHDLKPFIMNVNVYKNANKNNTIASLNPYIVNTTNCKIPNIDAWDTSIKGMIGKGKHIVCEKYQPFTYQLNDTIQVDIHKINRSIFRHEFSYCTYTQIIGGPNVHNSIKYGNYSDRFNIFMRVKNTDEHVLVKCFNKNGNNIFINFHTFIFEKSHVERRCTQLLKNRKDGLLKLNILVIKIDSVSRLNALRFMPKTVKYLRRHMQAIEMSGYNVVGYGTFDNLIPAFTGKFYKEIPWSFENPIQFDNLSFIWNTYKEHGYRTYLAEDFPNGGMFDYEKRGFKSTPTDYYNRPLFLSMYQQNKRYVYNEENCILHKGQTDWILDPSFRFLERYAKKQYFSVQLIIRLTHDYIERTAGADNIYYTFLEKLAENDLLTNTVLFFMSDHGMRFGNIRKSHIGQLEQRLPMLYIALPNIFREHFPEHLSNLRRNANKLTTSFDLYATWMHILHLDRNVHQRNISKRSISMFDDIPENRSCKDASVDPHWCSCAVSSAISINDSMIMSSANFFVKSINANLKPVISVCYHLRLGEIKNAKALSMLNKIINEQIKYYRLIITTEPGGAYFEGTIIYNTVTNMFQLGSEIDRINQYGKETKCGVNYLLEKLCYCKTNNQT